MNVTQQLITIGIVALITALTRFLPFLIFPASKPTPKYVSYLGKVLPPAVFGMLVVYCLKSTSVLAYPYGLPELIACLAVVALHLWKRNTLLSVGAGTILYMFLVQFVF